MIVFLMVGFIEWLNMLIFKVWEFFIVMFVNWCSGVGVLQYFMIILFSRLGEV